MNRFAKKINTTIQRRRSPRSAVVEELPKFIAHLNSPASEWVQEKEIVVSGWLLAEGDAEVKAVRVRNNAKYFDLKYGSKRHDVEKAYPELDKKTALHSGFTGKIKYEEGLFDIEADLGKGWQTVRHMTIRYSPEQLVDMLYNPNLSTNMAEHENLLDNKRKYYYEPATNGDYERHVDDPRLVAFYLPQYHPITENDRTWGKGFTEWTNVTAAKPRFVGHQQPFLPTDLGFYDLRLAENIEAQIKLAKQHGIYGFCFYYYWFSGKRLMEKPLDIFLEHKEWDFNFMIAWANENWTKRWDGLEDDIIVAQKYLESDPLDFIKDVEHILLDPRYIRENNKPVLIVYRGSRLGDPTTYAKVWREYFQKQHKLDLHIVSVLGLDVVDPATFGFDAGIEFEPLTVAKRTDFSTKQPVPINIFNQLLDKDFKGGVADYRQVALGSQESKTSTFGFPTYKSIMPSWDNDARKKGNGPTVFFGSNPDIYGTWLHDLLSAETKKNHEPLVFINAWNEWAEGTVLEPTKHSGHALLNRTTQVLAEFSKNPVNISNFPLYDLKKNSTTDLAVVVHVFYEEEWRYIQSRLKTLDGTPFDLFVTITERNKELADKIKKQNPRVHIYLVPNRGRDVLPFLFVANRLEKLGYSYVLKLHTKKSTHRDDGHEWFEGMVNDLLPNTTQVKEIMKKLQAGVSFIGPAGHYVSLKNYLGSNGEKMSTLLTRMYDRKTADTVLTSTESYGYFAGSMFWARLDGLKKILDLHAIPEDFESERMQVDGTLAHAVERLMSLISSIDGKMLGQSSVSGVREISSTDIVKNYEYAPEYVSDKEGL